jgi:hypothetical protein
VIGGRTAQANGKPGDCGACVDRGPELFANRDSFSRAQCSAVQCSAVPCGGCCDASSVMGGEGRKGIWSALLWLGCAKVYERKPHGPVRACRFFGLRRAVQNYPRYIQLGTRENQNSPSESFSTCINSGTQLSVGRADRVLQAACPCRWTSPLFQGCHHRPLSAPPALLSSNHSRSRLSRRQAASFHGYAIQCAIAHASEQDPD